MRARRQKQQHERGRQRGRVEHLVAAHCQFYPMHPFATIYMTFQLSTHIQCLKRCLVRRTPNGRVTMRFGFPRLWRMCSPRHSTLSPLVALCIASVALCTQTQPFLSDQHSQGHGPVQLTVHADVLGMQPHQLQQILDLLSNDKDLYEPTNDASFNTPLENFYIRLHRYLYKKVPRMDSQTGGVHPFTCNAHRLHRGAYQWICLGESQISKKISSLGPTGRTRPICRVNPSIAFGKQKRTTFPRMPSMYMDACMDLGCTG